MTGLLASLLLFAAASAPQEPGRDPRDLILEKDKVAAMHAVATIADPARRARLEAAMFHPTRRAAAMLAVAQAYPDSSDADAALHAGLAALLWQMDRAEALRVDDCLDGMPGKGYHEVDFAALAPLIDGLVRAVHSRRVAGGDPTTLRECERLVQIARVTRFGFEPVRVPLDARWEMPGPLFEPLQVRRTRIRPELLTWDRLRLDFEPEITSLFLPDAHDLSLPALPPGAWQVEIVSANSHWRAVRTIEVSDIDVVALAEAGEIAVLALSDGRVFHGRVRASANHRVLASTESRGSSLLVLPDRNTPAQELVADDYTTNAALLTFPDRDGRRDPHSTFVGHVMVDRPIHRPGETVTGRLVLRRCTTEGDDLDVRISAAPARHEQVEMTTFVGTDHEAQRSLETDAHGVLEFSIPIPEDAKPAEIALTFCVRDDTRGPWSMVVEPTRISSFRRPALIITAEGPHEIIAGTTASAQVSAIVHWASGGPAAAIRVEAEAKSYRSAGPRGTTTEKRDLVTDAEGRVVLPIDLTHLGPYYVAVTFTVDAPDGRRESVHHSIDFVDPQRSGSESNRVSLELRIDGEVVVAQNCTLQVHGEPDASVLVVAGRGHEASVATVQLDHAGEGSTTLLVKPIWWPMLDVCAATHEAIEELGVPIALRHAQPPVIDLPSELAPGAELVCAASGLQPRAVVTFAVVDERIYRLESDRTADPSAALRPIVPAPDWQWSRSKLPNEPIDVIAEMLRHGCVPPPDGPGRLGPPIRWPGTGGRIALSPATGDFRSDFKATALFQTTIADEFGVARVQARMPDDLTAWRVTVVAVDEDGLAFREERSVATRKALAAEPILPRVARAGDRFDIPVTLDHKDGASRVQFSAQSMSDALEIEASTETIELPAGQTATVRLRARAVSDGEPLLELRVSDGDHQDRSQRALTILADRVVRHRAIHAEGRGTVRLVVPGNISTDARMDLTLWSSHAALWRSFEQALARYPYGCVEQTLSRILPFFARARAARMHHLPPPTQDGAFGDRLAAGLKQLRSLLAGTDQGFAWWPGGSPDDAMTALVMHGLVVMREGGLDPRSVGLDFDLEAGRFRAALDRAVDGVDAGWIDIELAAASLRWSPSNERARAAVNAVVDRNLELAPGLLARLGLALAAAGDTDRAKTCLARTKENTTKPVPLAHGFPGEALGSAQALRIELASVLGLGETGDIGTLTETLLDGRASTYATSCALTALSLIALPEHGSSVEVVVSTPEGTHMLQLDAEHNFRARLESLPTVGCSITCESDRQLIARAIISENEPASGHAPWSTPLCVERELMRRSKGDDGEILPPLEGMPAVNKVCFVRVQVSSPVAQRYLVVECPLPAGFELVREQAGVDRFDDRFAVAIDWLAAETPVERRVAVVPTLAGRLLWPPAVASSMYDASIEGGSPGVWLEVVSAPVVTPAPTIPCFSSFVPDPEPIDEPTEPDTNRSEQLCAQIEEAWWEGWEAPWPRSVRILDRPPSVTQIATARAAAAELKTLAKETPEETLGPLLELDYAFRREDARGRAWPDWRVDLVREVHRATRTSASLALDLLESARNRTPRDRLTGDLAELAVCFPDGEEREHYFSRLLRCAIRADTSRLFAVLGDISSPPHTSELQALLREIVASRRDTLDGWALQMLGDDELDRLPASLLIELVDGSRVESRTRVRIFRGLASRDRDRVALFESMRKADFLRTNGDELLEALSAAMWRSLPLPSLQMVMNDAEIDRAVAFLVAQDRDIEELRLGLATSHDAKWSAALAQLLIERGVRTLPVAGDPADGVRAVWEACLAAAVDRDVESAARQIITLSDWDSPRAVVDSDGLFAILAPIVAAAPTKLDAVTWSHLFDALRVDRFDRLLEGVTAPLPWLPTHLERSQFESFWNYGLRVGLLGHVRNVIAASEDGASFIAHVDAPESPESPPTSPWERGVLAIWQDGVAKALSGPDARHVAYLLRLRGL